MQFSWPVFVIGLLLGVLQLAMGVIIGRALPLSERRESHAVRKRAGHLAQLAGRLFRLVHAVAEDVDLHQTRIKQANQDLAAAGPSEGGQLAEVVLKTVAEIVHVNERLQNRLSAAEEKLQQQAIQIQSHITEARTDPLTGLPNRRAFDDELVRRVAEWQRKKATFCLLLADIDHFKALNDRYGHPAGDEVLRGLAEALKTALREMDLVARIGGEEFGMILPSTNYRDAMHAAQRVRAAVAASRFATGAGTAISTTISLGLASVRTGDDPVALLRRADQALYASKHGGRNCGHYHDGETCLPIPLCGTVRPGGGEMDDAVLDVQIPPPDVELLDPAAMQSACEDLRARLSELSHGP